MTANLSISDFDFDRRFNLFRKKYYRIGYNGMIADFTESYDIDFIESVMSEPTKKGLCELERRIRIMNLNK